MILMMGLNHTTAPVELREQVTSPACTHAEALAQLYAQRDSYLFSEWLVLSTCNRTEIYTVTSNRDLGENALCRLFTQHETFGSSGREYLYTYTDREAIAHLFAVAASLDSMILGEVEILGQVRRAYLAAAERRSLGPTLHRLFHSAIHVGKRAHSETPIGEGAVSTAYAAVALARQQLEHLPDRRTLVIGAGEMAQRAAKHMAADGAILVTSRTFESATALALEIDGQAVHFEDLRQALMDVDLVISATAAPHLVVDPATVRAAMDARPGRPLCLIDMAVPRDIDPRVAAIPNVRLFNIDDLDQFVDTNRGEREKAVATVRAIIEEEAIKLWEWYSERRAVPVLAELHGRAEAVRQAELDKALRHLGHIGLSEHDVRVIASLSEAIVSKLLAAPTAQLKARMKNGDGQVYLDTLRELFELEEYSRSRPNGESL